MEGRTDLTMMMPARSLAPTLVVAYVAGFARTAARSSGATKTEAYERDLEAVRTAARELRAAAAGLQGYTAGLGDDSTRGFSASLASSRRLGTMALQAMGLTVRGERGADAADSAVMANELANLANELDELAEGDRRHADRIGEVFSSMARLAVIRKR